MGFRDYTSHHIIYSAMVYRLRYVARLEGLLELLGVSRAKQISCNIEPWSSSRTLPTGSFMSAYHDTGTPQHIVAVSSKHSFRVLCRMSVHLQKVGVC